jgi:hypothetical protein
MEAGVHSIWVSEQLESLGDEVIVANVRELRAISHSKSDQVDAEKLGPFCRARSEDLAPYRASNAWMWCYPNRSHLPSHWPLVSHRRRSVAGAQEP